MNPTKLDMLNITERIADLCFLPDERDGKPAVCEEEAATVEVDDGPPYLYPERRIILAEAAVFILNEWLELPAVPH